MTPTILTANFAVDSSIYRQLVKSIRNRHQWRVIVEKCNIPPVHFASWIKKFTDDVLVEHDFLNEELTSQLTFIKRLLTIKSKPHGKHLTSLTVGDSLYSEIVKECDSIEKWKANIIDLIYKEKKMDFINCFSFDVSMEHPEISCDIFENVSLIELLFEKRLLYEDDEWD